MLPGTDLTALTPVFTTAEGVTASPASGETVDLSGEVTYTFSREGEVVEEWTFSAAEMNSPVLPGLWADPNIAVVNDTYYIFATTDGFEGWSGNHFYVWKSQDLVTWEQGAEPFLVLDGENGNVPWATGNAWAPGFAARDGKYYFYFSGENLAVAPGHKSTGVAVADHPEGPYVALPEPMIPGIRGVDEVVTGGGTIDFAAFEDPQTGRWYGFWGNGEPCVMAEFEDDMVSLRPGTFRAVEGLTDFREAPFLNYRDGLYHLTYSIDDTRSENYRVGYATATSVHGPWTFRGVLLQKDVRLGILGTGHNSVLNVPGTDSWYIVYHRFATVLPNGGGFRRETTIDRLEIDTETGFFLPVTPTLESVGPHPIPQPCGGGRRA